MIADIAGQRRNKSGPQIILASAIFRTVWVDKGQPIFPQQLAVDVPAVFLDRVEPYKLQIQIVVRKRLVQRLRIILNVEQTAHTLKRRAERAADVLAIPAAAHFVQILMEAQFHMRFSYSYHILRISCDSISIACGALRRKFTVFHFGLHFSTHHAATAYLSMQRCNS